MLQRHVLETADRRCPACGRMEPSSGVEAWTGRPPSLSLRRVRAGPGYRVARAEEYESSQRVEDPFRSARARPPPAPDRCPPARASSLCVTEALPVRFAVPQGHDAPAAIGPRHADPEPSRETNPPGTASSPEPHLARPSRQNRFAHHQDCHFYPPCLHQDRIESGPPSLPSAPDRLNIGLSCTTWTGLRAPAKAPAVAKCRAVLSVLLMAHRRNDDELAGTMSAISVHLAGSPVTGT